VERASGCQDEWEQGQRREDDDAWKEEWWSEGGQWEGKFGYFETNEIGYWTVRWSFEKKVMPLDTIEVALHAITLPIVRKNRLDMGVIHTFDQEQNIPMVIKARAG